MNSALVLLLYAVTSAGLLATLRLIASRRGPAPLESECTHSVAERALPQEVTHALAFPPKTAAVLVALVFITLAALAARQQVPGSAQAAIGLALVLVSGSVYRFRSMRPRPYRREIPSAPRQSGGVS